MSVKVSQEEFNRFVSENKSKIDASAQLNPPLVRGGDWDSESTWDEDYDEEY